MCNFSVLSSSVHKCFSFLAPFIHFTFDISGRDFLAKGLQFLNHYDQMLPAANIQRTFKQSNI